MDFSLLDCRVALQNLVSKMLCADVFADGTYIDLVTTNRLMTEPRAANNEILAPWVKAKSLGQCTSSLIDPGDFHLLPGAVFVAVFHRVDGNMSAAPSVMYVAVREDGAVCTVGEPGKVSWPSH